MKKILAVALAVVMMFSVSVLAFAANPITQDTDQTETIDVFTVVDAADDTYTVTVPASVAIPWNNDDASSGTADYTVSCNLVAGSTLQVAAAANDGGVMNTTPAGDDTLTFALTGTTDAQSFSGYVTSQTVDLDATVSSFEGVAVGEYTGTMTYTVTYAAA